MPGQPEVTNSPNHFAGWRSSNDPLTRDLLDMGNLPGQRPLRLGSAVGTFIRLGVSTAQQGRHTHDR
jgi:hypothetical protein